MAEPKKKSAKKQMHPMRRFFSVLMIMIACLLTYISAQELITTVQLNQDIAEIGNEQASLQKQSEELEKQKAQFEDEEYVKRYARGKLLLSKEGDLVFKLPENNEEEK